VFFITNNSSKTREDLLKKFDTLEIEAQTVSLYTFHPSYSSNSAAASFLVLGPIGEGGTPLFPF
jgi:ribonucleotide monophosphatase NagD (HAD superfamily)